MVVRILCVFCICMGKSEELDQSGIQNRVFASMILLSGITHGFVSLA